MSEIGNIKLFTAILISATFIASCNVKQSKGIKSPSELTIECTNLKGVNLSYGAITSLSGKVSGPLNDTRFKEVEYEKYSLVATINSNNIQTEYKYKTTGKEIEPKAIKFTRAPSKNDKMVSGGFFNSNKFSQISYYTDLKYISITTHQHTHDLFSEDNNGGGLAEIFTIHGNCKEV